MKMTIKTMFATALILAGVINMHANDVVAQVAVADAPALPAVNWGLLVIGVVTPIFIAALKVLVPKIPKAWLPIIAPLFGALVDIITSGALGGGALMAAFAGSAGVGLREIVDQLKKAAEANKGQK